MFILSRNLEKNWNFNARAEDFFPKRKCIEESPEEPQTCQIRPTLVSESDSRQNEPIVTFDDTDSEAGALRERAESVVPKKTPRQEPEVFELREERGFSEQRKVSKDDLNETFVRKCRETEIDTVTPLRCFRDKETNRRVFTKTVFDEDENPPSKRQENRNFTDQRPFEQERDRSPQFAIPKLPEKVTSPWTFQSEGSQRVCKFEQWEERRLGTASSPKTSSSIENFRK
ncbi:unnamed protein product [Caenorhabditis auriculariae]|uniref:Uncharacterized protein n=1 Tax=Caenorhabditis auriculariae TaxID=2777116 RepID=A0A8S1HUJ4_9PELO|nr:unnamed protein product [Caenorhabditis auriculariae]